MVGRTSTAEQQEAGGKRLERGCVVISTAGLCAGADTGCEGGGEGFGFDVSTDFHKITFDVFFLLYNMSVVCCWLLADGGYRYVTEWRKQPFYCTSVPRLRGVGASSHMHRCTALTS